MYQLPVIETINLSLSFFLFFVTKLSLKRNKRGDRPKTWPSQDPLRIKRRKEHHFSYPIGYRVFRSRNMRERDACEPRGDHSSDDFFRLRFAGYSLDERWVVGADSWIPKSAPCKGPIELQELRLLRLAEILYGRSTLSFCMAVWIKNKNKD